MKKSNWIIIIVLVALVSLFPSCSEREDDRPDLETTLVPPGFDSGNDDEEPIILGDTTQINP